MYVYTINKITTDNMIEIENKTKEAFRLLNKRLKKTWDTINDTYTWGCASCLYDKYQPKSVEDFYIQYVDDPYDPQDPQYSGRNICYILQYAKKLQELDNCTFSIDMYYLYIIYHLITETYYGCSKETVLQEELKKRGYEVMNANDNDDIYNGIDLILSKDGKKYAIQCKPFTFFKGNNNKGLIEDRIKAIQKQENTYNKYRIPTYYVIYDHQGWIKNENDGYCFSLRQLITKEGKSLVRWK